MNPIPSSTEDSPQQLYVYCGMLYRKTPGMETYKPVGGWRVASSQEEATGYVTRHLLSEWKDWHLSRLSVEEIPSDAFPVAQAIPSPTAWQDAVERLEEELRATIHLAAAPEDRPGAQGLTYLNGLLRAIAVIKELGEDNGKAN